MTLQTQPIDVIFSKGLDTKTQEALVPTGSLLKAQNVTRQKSGEFRKRKGFQGFGNTTFTTPNAVTTFKNELVSIADSNLYSYDSNTKSWINKDSLIIGATNYERVHSNPTADQNRVALSVNGNLSLYTWVDSNLVKYSLRDNTTDTDLVIDQSTGLACTSGETYGVESIGNKFRILAGGSSNNLDVFTIQTTAGFATSTSTLVTDFDNTASLFDTSVYDNQLYISYQETGGNIRTLTVNTDLLVTNIQDISDTPATAIGVHAYMSDDGSEIRYAVAWNDSSDVVHGFIYNDNLIVKKTQTTLDTSQTNIKKITIHEDTTDDETIVVYWDRYDSSTPANTFIRTNTLDLSAAGTASTFMRSVDLYSKPSIYADKAYLAVKHESELQSTVFIVQTNTTDIIAKFAPSTTAAIETSSFVSPLRMVAASKFELGLDVRGRLISESNTLFTFSDAASGSIDFELNDAYNHVEAGNLLYIAGGSLHHYDGQFITEAGFHVFPEGISNSGTSTSGGSLSDGTYQYVAVYTWYDNTGTRHQSAPSEALSVTVSGGGSTQTVDIDVPTLRLTRKSGVRGSVIIDLYRTEDAGGIFYKTTNLTSIEENDTTVDSITITDGTSDTSLISNEILYTEGGVLDNIAAPACKRLAVFDNRLFLAGLHEPNNLQYSKVIRPGEGIGFNESLVEYIPQAPTEVTAVFSMDANLIIFKDNSVFVLTGSGPSNTGIDSSFIEPELLASDTGAIDSRSLVLGPDGIYFKSRKGIYMISRSLELSYIGAPAEDFNSKTVTSSVLIPDTNEIRFTTDDKVTISFNYLFRDWVTYNGMSVVDSTIWQNTHILMYTSGKIGQEYSGYRDAEAFYNIKLQTGWLKLSNLAGFQRIKRAIFYGSYQSAHKLRIKVYTDYSDTVRQTVVFDPTTILDQQNYFGDDTPFGNETPFGGSIDNDMYSFGVHIKQQKCQAIRFEIEDVLDPGVDPQNTGEALRIVGFTMEAGIKQGLNKLRSGRKS